MPASAGTDGCIQMCECGGHDHRDRGADEITRLNKHAMHLCSSHEFPGCVCTGVREVSCVSGCRHGAVVIKRSVVGFAMRESVLGFSSAEIQGVMPRREGRPSKDVRPKQGKLCIEGQ